MVNETRSPYIECPICGRATPIPPTINSNQDYPGLCFPENYTNSESLMTIAPVAAIQCTMYNCSAPATKYCFTCKKHLCEGCSEFHNYFFPDHKCTASSTALENAAYMEESLRAERDRMVELGRATPDDRLPQIPALAYDQARREEEERKAAEIQRKKREKEEKERRIKEELERKMREQERLQREKEEQERREREEQERREREEQERLEREREEQERLAREEQERKEREEQERLEREERERKEREEQERLAREEQERLEREEQERKEREELEKKKREERAVLPHPWRQLVDRSTGKVFYFNKETKQRSDVRPRPDGTLPGGPEEQQQEQQEQQPVEEVKKEEGNRLVDNLPPPPPPPPEEEEDVLPPDWIQLTDKRSGRIYFYNTTTKKTSWKRPTN